MRGRRVIVGATARTVPPRWFVIGVLGVFVFLALVLVVVVGVQPHALLRGGDVLQGPAGIDGWFQSDAGWYYSIARRGYSYVPGQQSSIAFFPTYPMAVRAVGSLLSNDQLAGSIVGVVSGAGAVVLFGLWSWQRLPRSGSLTAIAVLMLYPYAFFLYGPMYSDSLFLLTALGAFLLLERRRYWLAGLVGAFATAGRPVGIAVVVGLVVRVLELKAQDRVHESERDVAAGALAGNLASPWPAWRDLVAALRRVRWREAGVLFSSVGLLSWTLYLWVQFGNPLAFVAVESAHGWDQGVGPSTWFKLAYLKTILQEPDFSAGRLQTVQAIACVVGVLLMRRVWRRFGWGYTAYVAVAVAIPLIGTKDFMGMGRYLLVAFPLFAAAGDFLATTKSRWVRPVALVASAGMLIVLTRMFGQGVEVS